MIHCLFFQRQRLMRNLLLGIIIGLVIPMITSAQDETKESTGDFGIGLGIDYGGIGGRFAFRPSPKAMLFAGLGYNLNEVGYNVGAAWRLAPGKRTVPYLGAMYGYNAVVVVDNQSQPSYTFNGPSFTFGLEFHSRKNASNYFNLEILLPLRSNDFHNYVKVLKMIGYSVTEPWPIGFSLGYHWGF